MQRQYHFYVNDDNPSEVELSKKLKREGNISALVKMLLIEHYKQGTLKEIEKLKERYNREGIKEVLNSGSTHFTGND